MRSPGLSVRARGLCPLRAVSALAEATGRALGTGEHLCRGQAAHRGAEALPTLRQLSGGLAVTEAASVGALPR